MPQGYVVLLLHAHLPYVLFHGKWPHGSDWLCEATCETYIPLLNVLGKLAREGKSAHFTIGITPILCEMLAAPHFKVELKAYIAEKLAAASHDWRSFVEGGRKEEAELALHWHEFYRSRLKDFIDLYGEDLPGAFRTLQQAGQIELVVSAATHAYLPLLDLDTSISAQIAQGIETYRKHFRKEPEGMWLPECGYRPGGRTSDGNGSKLRRGIESFLAERNLKYFFLDGYHLLKKEGPSAGGSAMDQELGLRESVVRSGQYGEGYRSEASALAGSLGQEGQADLYAVHKTGHPESGESAFFVRDTDSSLQVWSRQWGYPGDPSYLEFHKKHTPGGLRYWRVTDHKRDLGTKQVYDPAQARARVMVHAAHFKGLMEERLERYHAETGRIGVLTLPFDAELFGHWWFEGMEWLYALASAFDENYVRIERASAVLQSIAPLDAVSFPKGRGEKAAFILPGITTKQPGCGSACVRRSEACVKLREEPTRRVAGSFARWRGSFFSPSRPTGRFSSPRRRAGDYGE